MRIPSTFQRKRPRIEIIPLIDIIFFLLATFVMVSLSMVKNQGVIVRLPSAVTSSPQERKTSVTVSMTEDGDVYLDKDEVTMDQLKLKLKKLKEEEPQIAIFINGDKKADFGKAIEILDQVRLLGITKVAVQTKNKP